MGRDRQRDKEERETKRWRETREMERDERETERDERERRREGGMRESLLGLPVRTQVLWDQPPPL